MQALKAKCQRLEYENLQLKGTADCEATSLPQVLNSIIDLNEMTQKHIEIYMLNQNEPQYFAESESKRISNTSFFTEEDRKEMLDQIDKANNEVNELKHQLSVTQKVIDTKNDEIKKYINKQVAMNKSHLTIEHQLEQYKNDITNVNQSNEQEIKSMRLKLIDCGVNEDKLKQEICELKSEVRRVQDQVENKISLYNTLKQELNSTKKCSNNHIQNLNIEIENANNSLDYAQCQNNELYILNEQLESQISLLEDEKQQLANQVNSLETEISDLSIQVDSLFEENQTLQETYEWNLNELSKTQDKLANVQIECDEKQIIINDLNEGLKSVTSQASLEQKNFQNKYYKCLEENKEALKSISELTTLHENAKCAIENYKAKIQDMNQQSFRHKSDIERLESDNKDLVDKCLSFEESMNDFQRMADKFREESTMFSKKLSQEKDLNQNLRFLHESDMKQANKNYIKLKEEYKDIETGVIGELKNKLESTHKDLNLTSHKLKITEQKYASFDQQLNALESEINQLNREKELAESSARKHKVEENKLLITLEAMESELKDIKQKNDELVGHNNPNQKVKYINKMREDCNNAVDMMKKTNQKYDDLKFETQELRNEFDKSLVILNKLRDVIKSKDTDSYNALKHIENILNSNIPREDFEPSDITDTQNVVGYSIKRSATLGSKKSTSSSENKNPFRSGH